MTRTAGELTKIPLTKTDLRRALASLVAAAAGLLAAQAWALQPGDAVENFRLMDHNGGSHHLYYYSDAEAVVVMVQGNGCPIVRNALPRYKELRDEYAGRGVQFLLLNANLQDDRDGIRREADEFAIDLPVLMDDTQLVGEALGLVRTGEVLVIDPQNWRLAYRGALDDRLTYEVQKAEAKAHYLKDALDNMLADEPVAVASTDAVGCLINFPDAKPELHAQISYAETIAPMLMDNCVDCHRPGGIGPWAMTGYDMIRGFAPMIREVVMTRRMPPWHADPAYGHFANDRSLSAEETRQLVHWIEAGAPRGDGADPLLTEVEERPEWGELGEPDLIIEIPPTEVPATGVVDYQYKFVENPLDRDVWVRASQIIPGDRAALHHVISRFGIVETEGPRAGRIGRRGAGGLSGYVPGMQPRELPEGTGSFLPADATIEFQMHYTTYGKASTDHSRIGIYFYDEPPEHRIESMVLANPRLKIPPHAKAHKETAARAFDTDVLVYALLPHAHFRGKASEFRAVYPDGGEEVLLSVPNYDFNWQTTYQLEEPKVLPAGTKVIHTTWWDNSAQNPANPDPEREVPWGEQSWDEMLFGVVSYRELASGEAVSEQQVAGGSD